jgi:hypothetical protein
MLNVKKYNLSCVELSDVDYYHNLDTSTKSNKSQITR